MTITSSICIVTITTSFLKYTMGGLVSFANFRGPEGNPCGSTKN